MNRNKIAITIDQNILARVDRLVSQHIFPNRSRAIQEAVEEKLKRFDKSRLARECAKLDPKFEKSLAGATTFAATFIANVAKAIRDIAIKTAILLSNLFTRSIGFQTYSP